jgi:chromate reductase, NAD(P)H dehydrogenase (quinone)
MALITGIAGSLRGGSFSHPVLASIASLLPESTDFQTIDIGAIPHYNQDLDSEAAPETVVAARTLVGRSDAVIIVTPEFNHGLPGVLKNTLDWLSRPAFSSTILGKPVMFATISPGALGGVRAQAQLRETLSSMLCRLVPLPEIAITHVGSKIEDGRLADAKTLAFIKQALDKFLAQMAPGAQAA